MSHGCRFVTSMRALPGIFGAACVVEVIQRAFLSWWGLGLGCTIQFKSSFLRVHVQYGARVGGSLPSRVGGRSFRPTTRRVLTRATVPK